MIFSRRQKILTTLILLSLAMGLFYFIYGSVRKSIDLKNLNFAKNAEEARLKEKSNAENQDYATLRAAEMQKNFESCKLVRKKDQNSCFFGVAKANGDSKICELIDSEKIRTDCLESFTYQKIIESGDIKNCNTLASSTRDLCTYEYFRKLDKVSDCMVLDGVDKQKCTDSVNGANAYKTGNETLCDQMSSDPLKSNCKQVVKNKPLDSDDDGLKDSDERSFGTNPLNKDSDADGLSDYDEIFKYQTSPIKKDTKENGYGDAAQKYIEN